MNDDVPESRPGQHPVEADDIEILEVVSVDENGNAATASPEDDLVVDFGDDAEAAGDVAANGRSGDRPAATPESAVNDRLVRLQADFDNLRKRIERERDDHYRHATGAFASRLLPVIDNFERAIAAGRQPGGVDALLEGVELVHRQFLDELRREGLRAMEAVGMPFDPEIHEAVATDSGSPHPPNSVVEVLQRGYYFHDRVLRPALVRVSVDGPGRAETEELRED